MATTPKQRKGARQLGIVAGLNGGSETITGDELRAKLGPLSVYDVVVVQGHYLDGYRSGKLSRESSLTARSGADPGKGKGQGGISSPGGGS